MDLRLGKLIFYRFLWVRSGNSKDNSVITNPNGFNNAKSA